MIKLPEKCLRGRDNCIPYAQIAADEEESFFCCGVHDGSISPVLSDKFTFCSKHERYDTISMNDKRDLIHNAAVILQALAVIEELETDENRKYSLL